MKKKRELTDSEKRAGKRLSKLWDKKKADLNITQEKAAGILGFNTQGAVGHYLRGRTALNLEATLKFSGLLRVRPSEIYPEIIPPLLKTHLEIGFMERSRDDMEVYKIAEEIQSLPPSQRAALRIYIEAITDKDVDKENSAP